MVLAISGVDIVFWALFVAAAIAAIFVVTSRNVVRAALYLVGVLGSAGALYLLLGAEFVGWTQVLIYVGAIVVLLLFGIMLTKAPIGGASLDNQQRPVAALIALATFGGLTWLIWRAFGTEKIVVKPVRTDAIGDALFTNYVLPFEAVSVLLLAALVGAIVLARRD